MNRGFVGIALIIAAFAIVALGAGGWWYMSQPSVSPVAQLPTLQEGTNVETQAIVKPSAPTPKPSPTPVVNSETANWKTYTNTEYGFSFKYPPGFTFASSNQTVAGVTPFEWWAIFNNEGGGQIILSIHKNTPVDVNAKTITQTVTIMGYADDGSIGGTKTVEIDVEQVMVGTKKGIQQEGANEGSQWVVAVVPLGDDALSISFMSNNYDMRYGDNIYGNATFRAQILSTFQFSR